MRTSPKGNADHPQAASSTKTQADKFREAAKEVEADDDEKRFAEQLKRLGKPLRNPKIAGKPAA